MRHDYNSYIDRSNVKQGRYFYEQSHTLQNIINDLNWIVSNVFVEKNINCLLRDDAI